MARPVISSVLLELCFGIGLVEDEEFSEGREFSLSDYDRIGEVVLRFNDAARFQQSLTGATRCGDTAKNGWKNPQPIRSNDSGDID